jgi:hypothetical protein
LGELEHKSLLNRALCDCDGVRRGNRSLLAHRAPVANLENTNFSHDAKNTFLENHKSSLIEKSLKMYFISCSAPHFVGKTLPGQTLAAH